MKRIIILILLLFVYYNVFSQLSTGESPWSFNSEISQLPEQSRSIPIVTTPALDMAQIEKEDMEKTGKDILPRYGYSHEVCYDLDNSGIWRDLPNGDKLWQLRVVCPNALSVNFLFDKFWLPDGGKLFVYSYDHKQSIGAFTSRNNKGDRLNLRGFATGLIFDSDVVLEYYQPVTVNEDAVISIKSVIHGYRYISEGENGYGHSSGCQVNVNCAEGQQWQREKNAVALILVDDRVATGSLVNTTDLGQKPYLLTANHCLESNQDAEENPNLDNYIFYWMYESYECSNGLYEPQSYCTSGATVIANNVLSDFALLRLIEDPKEISNYQPYYLGWDCSGLSGDMGVCIHHPSGDVKKISTVESQPTSITLSYYTGSDWETHWAVTWKTTQNGHGTTEPGSSGSPLINSAHRVIGQLTGGESGCYWEYLNNPDWFGKFSVSWTGEGNTSIYRRLDCWLDSLDTGQTALDGLLVINSSIVMDTDEQLYSNIHITDMGYLTIQGVLDIRGNGLVIVDSGCSLIIDGGSLTNAEIVLKPGSNLRIINGGTIVTRNGFDAPVGTIVSIEQGQII